MTTFVVYHVEFGDVGSTGPACWRGQEVGRFNTEAEADAFVDSYNDFYEIVLE
jgi:hypothetical protein